jgi:hypothetical protein
VPYHTGSTTIQGASRLGNLTQQGQKEQNASHFRNNSHKKSTLHQRAQYPTMASTGPTATTMTTTTPPFSLQSTDEIVAYLRRTKTVIGKDDYMITTDSNTVNSSSVTRRRRQKQEQQFTSHMPSGGPQSNDIMYLVNIIRCLIETNWSVVERIRPNIVYYNHKDNIKNRGSNIDDQIVEIVCLYRPDYSKSLRSVFDISRRQETFMLLPALIGKEFELPPDVPEWFHKIAASTSRSSSTTGIIPTFDSFLEQHYLLEILVSGVRNLHSEHQQQEDALEIFLHHFKRHLEQVQVRLGEIESWLFDSEKDLRYIEEAFKTIIKRPNDDVDDDNSRENSGICTMLQKDAVENNLPTWSICDNCVQPMFRCNCCTLSRILHLPKQVLGKGAYKSYESIWKRDLLQRQCTIRRHHRQQTSSNPMKTTQFYDLNCPDDRKRLEECIESLVLESSK